MVIHGLAGVNNRQVAQPGFKSVKGKIHPFTTTEAIQFFGIR